MTWGHPFITLSNTDCWNAWMQATGISKDQIWSTFVHWRKRQFVLLHFLCKVFVFWLLYKYNQQEFKLSVITAENFLYITLGKISCHIRSRPFYNYTTVCRDLIFLKIKKSSKAAYENYNKDDSTAFSPALIHCCTWQLSKFPIDCQFCMHIRV